MVSALSICLLSLDCAGLTHIKYAENGRTKKETAMHAKGGLDCAMSAPNGTHTHPNQTFFYVELEPRRSFPRDIAVTRAKDS